MNWKASFSNRYFRIEFIVTIFLLASVLLTLTSFLNYIELREGVVFNDPVLNLYEPVNATWFTFGLIYFSLITAIFFFIKNPGLLLKAFQSYIMLVIIRMTAMYLLPLNPPVKMIPLNDPFVELFGTGEILTKDLFFSGHTATLFLLFLLADLKSLKLFLLISTVMIGIFVLLQHVHYSIDVFAAPFFAYCSFKFTEIIRDNYLPSVS